MTTTTRAPHEASAWLRGAVADRLAVIDQRTDLPDTGVIVGPLGRTGAGAPGSREDRSCDRCSDYTPPGEDFHPFSIHPRPDVVLIAGLCARCARREGIR